MNTNELMQAYILTGQKIDVLWNFYVTVHLAIAGFLLYSKSRIDRWQITVTLSIAYIFFSIINYRAKAIEYNFLNSITKDIAGSDVGYASIESFFSSLDFTDRTAINMAIHILSIVFIVVIYVFSQSKNEKNNLK